MSLFFSVHYLTIYYLLQPYNAGTELKSGTYRFVLSATYLVCFFLMQQRIPILLFERCLFSSVFFTALPPAFLCICLLRVPSESVPEKASEKGGRKHNRFRPPFCVI